MQWKEYWLSQKKDNQQWAICQLAKCTEWFPTSNNWGSTVHNLDDLDEGTKATISKLPHKVKTQRNVNCKK